MSKHAPGPWSVYSPDDGHECPGIEAKDFSIVIFGERLTPAEYCGVQGRSVEEAKANARLIAAAPDLLEALNRLSAQCDRLRLPGQPMSDAEKNARDVIAKATGSAA